MRCGEMGVGMRYGMGREVYGYGCGDQLLMQPFQSALFMASTCHTHTFEPIHSHPGTDEATIINLLVTRNNSQRQDIRKRFKLMYGKVSFPKPIFLPCRHATLCFRSLGVIVFVLQC